MISFRQAWAVPALGLALFALNGCATQGDRYAEMAQLRQAPAPGMARVYIYRKPLSVDGALVQPVLDVNGKAMGKALANGFFFVEGAAGDYKISTDGDIDHAVTVNVPAGQVRYVRLDVSMGLLGGHATPVLVDAAEGSKDIQDCHHQSPDL